MLTKLGCDYIDDEVYLLPREPPRHIRMTDSLTFPLAAGALLVVGTCGNRRAGKRAAALTRVLMLDLMVSFELMMISDLHPAQVARRPAPVRIRPDPSEGTRTLSR